MKAKTITLFIIIALLALLLFKNREDTAIWIFGARTAGLHTIILTALLLGIAIGFALGRATKQAKSNKYPDDGYPARKEPEGSDYTDESGLSDEDRDYIS